MFYDRLKTICEKKQTSITAVVKAIGVSTGNISKWKQGALPNSIILDALAQHLCVSADDLLGREQVVATSREGYSIDGLSAKERDALTEYLAFLRTKK